MRCNAFKILGRRNEEIGSKWWTEDRCLPSHPPKIPWKNKESIFQKEKVQYSVRKQESAPSVNQKLWEISKWSRSDRTRHTERQNQRKWPLELCVGEDCYGTREFSGKCQVQIKHTEKGSGSGAIVRDWDACFWSNQVGSASLLPALLHKPPNRSPHGHPGHSNLCSVARGSFQCQSDCVPLLPVLTPA